MILVLDNIKKAYNGRTVLKLDKLSFKKGRVYAILGANGSGKSTMLRIICGMEKPDAGRLEFAENAKCKPWEVAYLPQKPYIFDKTVLKNVMLGIVDRRMDKNLAEDLAITAIQSVGMGSFVNAGARALSGGEAQRIAVARTLVLSRDLVLLDEPASSVDVKSMRLMEAYIKREAHKRQSTIIFSTHNIFQACRTADEIIVLREGIVIESGTPEMLLKAGDSKGLKAMLEEEAGGVDLNV